MTQRVRITFRKHGPARYVAHLDLMRTWERALRRARLPLAYTHGFSPHPRLQLAAPLPVGTIGERELLDAWLEEQVAPAELTPRLVAALPTGLDVVAVEDVSERLPALQASLLAAHYEARLPSGHADASTLREAVSRLLALDTLDWEEDRGDKTRRYDLRASVLGLHVRDDGDDVVLEARLSLQDGRSGRPSSVLAALGIEVAGALISRTAIELTSQAALERVTAGGP